MNEITKQRKEFPFDTEALTEHNIPILNMVASMDREDAMEFIKTNYTEIYKELSTLKLLNEYYENMADSVRNWIRKEFQIDDVDEAITELMLARKNSDDSTINTGTSNSSSNLSSTNTSNFSSADQIKIKPPAIRLKLHTSPTTTNNNPISEQPVRRGSKNLSRMNRPQDSGKSIELKPKLQNQIPITVFWNYVDPFFKNIEENDAKYLEDPAKVFDPTFFTIPPLGKHFLEQWRDAYGYLPHNVNKRGGLATIENVPKPSTKVHSLKDRLLSMLIEESDYDVNDLFKDDLNEYETDEEMPQTDYDLIIQEHVVTLNERIRKDMAEMGLIDSSFVKEYAEDDEICNEIRILQSELKKKTLINNYRKHCLYEFIRKYLPAQEFWSLIGDLDKQIELAFIRLSKQQPSSKKRKALKKPTSSGHNSPPPPPQILNEGEEAALKLLERREKLMENISSMLPSRLECLCPSISNDDPLFDPIIESQLVEDAEKTGGWMRYIIDSLYDFDSAPLYLSDPISFNKNIVNKN